MPPKPRRLFVDTNAVGVAHGSGTWEFLCQAYEVCVPEEIIDEATVFVDRDGNPRYLNLRDDLAGGRITTCAPTLKQLAHFSGRLHPNVKERIHAGELHLLACLSHLPDLEGVALVTGDAAAIWVAHALDISLCSLEAALEQAGRRTPNLREDVTEAKLAQHRMRGSREHVQGRVILR